jgi:hypothetical protein
MAIAPFERSLSEIPSTACTMRDCASTARSHPRTETSGAPKNWSATRSNSSGGRKPVAERSFSPSAAPEHPG